MALLSASQLPGRRNTCRIELGQHIDHFSGGRRTPLLLDNKIAINTFVGKQNKNNNLPEVSSGTKATRRRAVVYMIESG